MPEATEPQEGYVDPNVLTTIPTGHVPWPSIEDFPHMTASVRRINLPFSDVRFHAKIKLHGTNAAIRFKNGKIFYQSRSNDITPESDNYGFAKAMSALEIDFQNTQLFQISRLSPDAVYIVYGEWAGSSIQKGVALSKVEKGFHVFAIRQIFSWPEGVQDRLYDEPEDISYFLSSMNEDLTEAAPPFLKGVYVIPWYEDGVSQEYRMDFTVPSSVNAQIERINALVDQIGVSDPYVKSLYNEDGTGEGLVFYPIVERTTEHYPTEMFRRLSFKAKSEAHRVKKTSAAVKLLVEKPEGVSDFVSMFVTEARCLQILQSHCNNERIARQIGPFIKGMLADIEKESVQEREASGLDWKTLQGDISAACRKWMMPF